PPRPRWHAGHRPHGAVRFEPHSRLLGPPRSPQAPARSARRRRGRAHRRWQPPTHSGGSRLGMIAPFIFAFVIGLPIILSRQVNGRLSLSTTPLISSFWNHLVGLVFITLLGLAIGDLIPPNLADIPLWVYLGGAIGVVFVASG